MAFRQRIRSAVHAAVLAGDDQEGRRRLRAPDAGGHESGGGLAYGLVLRPGQQREASRVTEEPTESHQIADSQLLASRGEANLSTLARPSATSTYRLWMLIKISMPWLVEAWPRHSMHPEGANHWNSFHS